MYRHLRIADPVNGHGMPRNIALLFFSQNPEQWFPGARIEVVQFAADESGNVIDEKIITMRPIHEQLYECLAYLDNLSVRKIEKHPDSFQATHWLNYPVMALREAVANAVYHRAYEGEPEPIKIYLYSGMARRRRAMILMRHAAIFGSPCPLIPAIWRDGVDKRSARRIPALAFPESPL